jgi:Mce-associated membrane protein
MMPSNSTSSSDDAFSPAAQAEAKAAEAEAQAVAVRATAQELPSRETGDAETEADPDTADDGDLPGSADAPDTDHPAPARARSHRKRLVRAPGWRGASIAAATVMLCALLAAGGYLYWQDQQASERRAHRTEFSAAAGQAVVNLLSLDFNKGDADVKRLIDSTTGEFRADFEKNKNDFMTVMKDAEVVTHASVRATAVESMTDDSAVVLIAAMSKAASSGGTQHPTRHWRLSVTVERDNGVVKMSKVEFMA